MQEQKNAEIYGEKNTLENAEIEKGANRGKKQIQENAEIEKDVNKEINTY